MSLPAFFQHMGAYLTGEAELRDVRRALGPLPSRDVDYAFYRHLLEYDQAANLGELYGPVRAWLERDGWRWADLCADFFRDCPPRGHSVPHLGEGFSDWLVARRTTQPTLPVGVEALTDLIWTRFLARTAPDDVGLGLNQRLFVRQYSVDAVAVRRAAVEGSPMPDPTPAAFLVFRCFHRGTVHELRATRAALATLLVASGAPVPAALVLSEVEAVAERERLERLGVIPIQPLLEESS